MKPSHYLWVFSLCFPLLCTFSARAQGDSATSPMRIFMPGELTADDVLEALLPETATHAYKARKTHRVDTADLAACPELGENKNHVAELAKRLSPQALNVAIGFGNNSNQIDPQASADLQKLALGLSHPLLKDRRFLIEGHANKVAGDKATYNHRLSCERAAKVREVLRKQFGISADRLDVLGMGFAQPLPGIDPADVRNRRVVIRRLFN